MTAGDRSRPGKGRADEAAAGDDDAALWAHVARSVEVFRGKGRVRVRPDPGMPETMPPRQEPPAPAHIAAPRKRSTVAPLKPQPAAKAPDPVREVELDRRKARRLARGTDEIEARLDLHGMTQDEACSVLDGFIRRCHASGMRTVLVITGKGGAGGRHRGHDDVHVRREEPPRGEPGGRRGVRLVGRGVLRLESGAEVDALEGLDVDLPDGRVARRVDARLDRLVEHVDLGREHERLEARSNATIEQLCGLITVGLHVKLEPARTIAACSGGILDKLGK